MTFSQEFERAGHGEENVRSMIFIDKAEMRELKKLNSRYQTMNDAALSEFLMAKRCRQQSLNVYYNEEDVDIMIYEKLNGNRCDRYNARDQMNVQQK